MSRGPDAEWGVSPRPRELDSRGGAAHRGSGIDGAVNDASVRGASGGLSSDEGRSKGENGESGRSEHGVECGVGAVCKGRMDMEGECKQVQHAGETCRVVGHL